MRTANVTCAVVIGLLLASCTPDESEPGQAAQDLQAGSFLGTKTITVNTGTSTGAVMWGGIGFLYGLSESPNLNGYTLSDSMLTGLVHPQYTSQKAPWGAQHPDGDALNTAVQFKRVGGRGVGIYVQDFYVGFPYPNNGLSSYLTNVVDPVTASVKADRNRTFMHYVPFNEPDWIWYATSGARFTQFLADWKTTFNRIRTNDPGAKIAGPNFSHYDATAYRSFFTFAKANGVLPDIVTWHELDGSLFNSWYSHYNDYRQIESDLTLSRHEIFINEYARSSGDLAVPGNLVQYLARFENSKVFGGLAFWHGIGNLDDLVANTNPSQSVPGSSLNTPDAAWYLYQWYGQMSGNTVDVVLPSLNGSLQALASRSGSTVKVIFGGALGPSDTYDAQIVLTGLSGSSASYKVYSTDESGTSPAAPPSVVKSGTATISGGKTTISYTNAFAHSAYLLQLN